MFVLHRIVLLGCVWGASGAEYVFERVQNFTGLENAGYAFLSAHIPGQLLLNRFGAAPFFGKSQVSLVDIKTGSHVDVATNIDWPNVGNVIDTNVFGFPAAIIGSGFLVPSHTTGGIWIVDLGEKPMEPVKITKDIKGFRPDSGWFYHEGILRDMNGDGLLDIVTSRCAFSVFPWNPKAGKLVWLERPKQNPLQGNPWVEHEMSDGPDFLFTMAPAAISGEDFGACAAEYIGERLTYVHGNEKDGYSTRVVDPDLGNGFGCTWVDLNADGTLDLLATNHLLQNGSVFAYTWDGDLRSEKTVVKKHVLATGFSAAKQSKGQASPGDAIPFFVKTTGNDGAKPLLLVSADNGNYISVLVPNAHNDDKDMTYKKQFIEYIGSDVGRIAIGDTDGDGVNELFVPAYDAGQLLHYKISIKESTAATVVV